MTVTRVPMDRAARSVNSMAATMRLFASGLDPATLREMGEMQQAAWQRFWTLQQSWAADWSGWWRYATDDKGVNTLSKLAERASNSATQLVQLAGDQMTGLVELQEGVEVSYAYWISQKVGGRVP
jgi:hypothetical protein